MFNTIKTSKENKERVLQLTRKLNLGPENIIARMAFAYSISKGHYLELKEAENSGGKEYSYKVLFGEYGHLYMSMVCVHYNIHISDKDIGRYVKMHIDDGLELLDKEYQNSSGSSTDFLMQRIEDGLKA